jgi:hypothetical protein
LALNNNKGMNNVLVVAGGLKRIIAECPELIEGRPPLGWNS